MNRQQSKRGTRGVTLTELLVVLAIISLLATILIPVTVNKMEQARIATARQEVRELAQAEDSCAVIHGFYVPLHILDDLNPNTDLSPVVFSSTQVNPDILSNSIQASGGIFVIDPNRSILDQVNFAGFPGTNVVAPVGQLNLASPGDRQAVPRLETMYQFWAGPFIDFHRYFTPNPTADPQSAFDVRQDYPLDPWGQAYRFYSPLGIIGQNADQITNNWPEGSFNGRLTRNFQEPFDRWAIVSWGPNGIPNFQTPTRATGQVDERDDITYEFGGIFSESSFKAFGLF